MTGRVERRLTTILATDVAEYSRLMRADEEATLSVLAACRSIIDALIAEHRGQIANTAGDSVLAEFPSVAAALAFEKALAIGPGSFDLFLRRRVPWFRPEHHAHMVEGLRKAGWQGQGIQIGREALGR